MYSKIILFILLPIFGFSQAPQKINFQSILRNNNGEIVSNKSVSLKISILSGSIGGSAAYSETHTKTTDASGLISLQIGNGTVLSGVFANIAWGDFPHFIKLEADFSGGNNYVLLGTQELMSVPYALYASKTDTSSLNLVNRFSTKLNGTDTVSLSNRIDTKASLSDTSLLNLANRFSSKLNGTDTASLSERIDTKLNKSDTSLLNLTSRLATKLNVTDTAFLSNRIDTKASLSDTNLLNLTSRFATKLNVTDTASLSNRIDTKLNVTDTAFLSNRIDNKLNKTDTSLLNLTSRLATKLNATDTTFLSERIDNKLNKTDTSLLNLTSRLATKLNVTDTASLSERIDAKLTKTDTASLSNRIDTKSSLSDTSLLNLTSRLATKLNVTDTTSLSNRIDTKASLSDTSLLNLTNRFSSKVNITDTSSMLNPYLRKADAIVSVETDPVFNSSVAKGITGIDTAYWNRKLNLSDTSNMLSNYRTGLNNKVNFSDTSDMLNPYLRKSDSIIADLQNQDKLLQSFSNVIDIDGNNYKTVKIGTQIWMSENLKTSRYRNGDVIPVVTDNTAWIGLASGGRCWYENDSSTYENNYGILYNSYAATDSRGICPLGWHLPTYQEWETLTYFLGGTSNGGGKMKYSGTTFWSNPNTDANNESGFSALPSGYRSNNAGGGSFSQIGKDFWMILKGEINVLHFRNLHYASNSISGPNAFGYWNHFNETSGVSIRCLKDPDQDFNQGLNIKVNIADTSLMLNPYLRKADAIVSVETDPVFNSSVAKGITGIDTAYWNRKLNLSDTSNMLSNYRIGLNNKVNVSDTSNMLSNYRTGLNNKVNISDTTSMLNPYLRKSDSIITDLQNQDKLLQSFSNVVDIDGNSYKTVKIGTQIWMSENLKTSRYRNGGPIPNVVGNTDWQALSTGAWCYYNHDEANNTIYGKLYNWFSIQGDTLCPTGWHVPSDAEFTTLTTYLGGESVAGGKMKVTGTTYWNSPNAGATNESGFSALPGGYFFITGSFHSFREITYFWSATEDHPNYSWSRFLFTSTSNIARANTPKSLGASVRCLKDSEIDNSQSLNLKVNIADTSSMLNPYLRKADAIINVETDPVFNTSVAKGITGIDTAYWNRKLNITDTSSMLTNYKTGLNNKVNFSDTANMLANYKAMITDLQKQLELLSALTAPLDIDGNKYHVVKIGDQIWMKENLRVSRYNNGDSIPTGFNNADWINTTNGAYAIYNNPYSIYNSDSTNNAIFGKLYNWYAVNDSRKLCPAGWHVPSDAEFTTLTTYLGGESVAGGKMKSISSHWNGPNIGANNESGFSALPGGNRQGSDGFFNVTLGLGFFWSSTQDNNGNSWYRMLTEWMNDVSRLNSRNYSSGNSIRCIKD